MSYQTKIAGLLLLLGSLSGYAAETSTAAVCYVVFDAGSSGTRLYVYERQEERQWLEHAGPKVSALADPVRQIRGKTHADVDAVTSEVVDALDKIKQDGSPDKQNKPAWLAFDWASKCRLQGAYVYATAGMRLAEQENREQSALLWGNLKRKLQDKVGVGVAVSARTLTGYEEGLYAWLSVREQKQHNRFGIAEMGGASAQVTFPCPKCRTKDDAVKTVMVAGKPLRMYSYSFLGLGMDEAPKTIGHNSIVSGGVCEYGAALSHANWKKADCAHAISIADAKGIRDPFNYRGNTLGTTRQVPLRKAAVDDWFLTGVFTHMNASELNTCCQSKGQCFNEATSCFRSVYLGQYLHDLNLPKTAQKADASWTLGAVLCGATQCLQRASKPICRWSNQGCL